MLSIRNLTKKFDGIIAVQNLSLEVKDGEIYSLIGPNGSGKTTTVKSITGLYQPTAGDISVAGASVLRAPEKAKSAIGYIPDDPFVYERLTGREFLHLVG
ncbi:MAG: ATP-binding cassette domain-containing protein, partial [Candidatus Sungbacteria bacterium]|nr:ATP-binding cassette domain-containing protein [Candidatus Sungbacteria bacterium]